MNHPALGSTTDLTDDQAVVVDGYTYDVFGALCTGSAGATDFLYDGLGSVALASSTLIAAYTTQTSWRFWQVHDVRWLIVLTIILAFIALTACDPGAGITWVNDTDRTVVVYLDDEYDDSGITLQPRSSATLATIEAVWNDMVVIRDEEGTVLFRRQLTWNEFEEQGFRFEITEEMLSPTPIQAQ